MKSTLATLALAVGSHALVPRDELCCFHLTASGPSVSGPVGQLTDGQNRVGDKSLPEGEYCIGPDGGLTDGEGRGCILTPPTTQFQCDAGATPTPGFSIAKNGELSYKGEATFYACQTGLNGGYNLYDMPIKGQDGCVELWLMADKCKGVAAPPPSQPIPKACPAELTGSWEFPHLIVPINAADAEKAYGTQYNSTASGSVSSIFNFDIPQSYAGKQCTLEFLFPTQDQLETSAYEHSPGHFQFAYLDGVATQKTNYANAPKALYDFGSFELKPGTATVVGTCPFGCPAGEAVSFWMSPIGSASLNYFQDSNPCPIGLYVTAK